MVNTMSSDSFIANKCNICNKYFSIFLDVCDQKDCGSINFEPESFTYDDFIEMVNTWSKENVNFDNLPNVSVNGEINNA